MANRYGDLTTGDAPGIRSMRNSISRTRGKTYRSSGISLGKFGQHVCSSSFWLISLVTCNMGSKIFSGSRLDFKNLAIWKRNTDNLFITIDDRSVVCQPIHSNDNIKNFLAGSWQQVYCETRDLRGLEDTKLFSAPESNRIQA
ncbi:hypothetical protein Tco_1173880 [Tanacetum coccineum]